MIQAGFARHGLSAPMPIAWDSLDLARRLVRDTSSFRLEDLVGFFQIPSRRSHRALDDVLATVSLSERLRAIAEPQRALRRAVLVHQGAAVARLRATLDRWTDPPLRPGPLIRRIAKEALRFKYPSEPRRLAHLATLADRLEALDDPDRSPAQAVSLALTRAALSRDTDLLDGTEGVRVVTMHQAKGLEFDRVFVPGLTDGALPGWRALRAGDPASLDEERRVFYVAVTRARKRLHLSLSSQGRRGQSQTPSSFLDDLLPHLDGCLP
jgi:DNA helicase-2/ATP-dependent DNA helicase PcrA